MTKEQKQQGVKSEYQITKVETDSEKDKFVKNELIEKIFKNYRGVKKCNDGINRLDKENQREIFRTILGFKENEIYERKEYSIVKRIKKYLRNK